MPEDGKLRVELYGDLAALISLTNQHPRSKGAGVQVTLVAWLRGLQPPRVGSTVGADLRCNLQARKQCHLHLSCAVIRARVWHSTNLYSEVEDVRLWAQSGRP